jgi:hypothetical protein
MHVAVQRVRLSWTKLSRGAPGAALRNARPAAFRLPWSTPPFFHTVDLSEADGFTPRASMTTGSPSRDELLLHERNGLLNVQLTHNPFGRPDRWPLPPVRLQPGETLRWQINYRFGAYDHWSYRLDTFNVAYDAPATPDLFLAPPTRTRDERTHLR